ncbi:hypothetical protein [Vibrio crassostreae]|uniref:hypothetical protein n=1 Tax=Vibrio crassostreae TaxID=246167 RepID=UPI001B301E02|nr:hypothetical protein [Vibrio crassostreae]
MEITFGELSEFLSHHYKPSRLHERNSRSGWDEKYAAGIINRYLEELKNIPVNNKSIISKHESIAGEAMTFNRIDVLKFHYRALSPKQVKKEIQKLEAFSEQKKKHPSYTERMKVLREQQHWSFKGKFY